MSDIEKIYTFLKNASHVYIDGKEVSLEGMRFVMNRICFPSSLMKSGNVVLSAKMENGEHLEMKMVIENVKRKSLEEELNGSYTTPSRMDVAFSSGMIMEF